TRNDGTGRFVGRPWPAPEEDAHNLVLQGGFALRFARQGVKTKFRLNRIILSECPSLPVTGLQSATETATGTVTSCCPSGALRPASRRSSATELPPGTLLVFCQSVPKKMHAGIQIQTRTSTPINPTAAFIRGDTSFSLDSDSHQHQSVGKRKVPKLATRAQTNFCFGG